MENVLLHEIQLDDQPMDVDIHPTQRLLASGVIDGHLVLHDFGEGTVKQRHKVKAHASSCRAVRFSGSSEGASGSDLVYTASTDCSILAVDVATGAAQARKKEAHDSAINRLAAVGGSGLASGDDEGIIKVWDSRQSDAVATLEAHSEYVSDMCVLEDKGFLLSTSGDGTLAVIDLRKNKIIAQSEGDADDELLSVAVLKGGRKVACGSTSGVLDIWSWGYWNDCSDRFPGHPESVTSILRYDDDTVLTGSSDGLIRILTIQPNKMLGVLGEHSDYPIERLSMSADRAVLASASHDNTVKLWDLKQLEDDGDEEEEEEEAAEEGAAEKGAAAAAEAAAEEQGTAGEQQAAAAAAEGGQQRQAAAGSDSDSDSDSDDGKARRQQAKRKAKGQHKILSKKQAQRGGGNFFADLL